MDIESIQCNRCGKSFSVRSMMADASGKGLICQNCFELVSQVRKDADKLIQNKFNSAQNVGIKPKGKLKEIARRVREGSEYVCRDCNYRFISSLKPIKCPYCSENKLVVVEKVVKEIDELVRG